MNIPRPALAFLSAALLIALVWGLMEIVLFESRSGSPVCAWTPASSAPLRGHRIASRHGSRVWTFAKDSASFHQWQIRSSGAKDIVLEKLRSDDLSCGPERPRNCFPRGGELAPKSFDLITNSSGDGVLTAHSSGTSKSFPISFQEDGFRLGPPIKLCGHSLDHPLTQVISDRGSWMIGHPETGRIGVYRLGSAGGFHWRAAAREADRLWVMDEAGHLRPGTCEEPAFSSRFKWGPFGDGFWMQKDDPRGTQLLNLSFREGIHLEPLAGPLSDHFEAWSLDRQNLFSMNPIEGKWALSKATRAGIEVRSGDKGFRDAGHFVLTTAGRILGLKAPRGIRRLEIHDAENPEGSPLAQSPLQVRLRQITRWVPVNESDTHLDFLLQSGDEIQAHRIFCPGGINRPSK